MARWKAHEDLDCGDWRRKGLTRLWPVCGCRERERCVLPPVIHRTLKHFITGAGP